MISSGLHQKSVSNFWDEKWEHTLRQEIEGVVELTTKEWVLRIKIQRFWKALEEYQ
jgi:hypothetical protein